MICHFDRMKKAASSAALLYHVQAYRLDARAGLCDKAEFYSVRNGWNGGGHAFGHNGGICEWRGIMIVFASFATFCSEGVLEQKVAKFAKRHEVFGRLTSLL